MMKRKNILISLALVAFVIVSITGMPFVLRNFQIREANKNIKVSGVVLGMTEEQAVKSIGSKGEFAMCVYGYEHTYEELGLNVGYRADNHRVRRINITNEKDRVYGINKGMNVDTARDILVKNEFIKDTESNYKFNKKNIRITLLSKEGSIVDGISIEEIDGSLINKVY